MNGCLRRLVLHPTEDYGPAKDKVRNSVTNEARRSISVLNGGPGVTMLVINGNELGSYLSFPDMLIV